MLSTNHNGGRPHTTPAVALSVNKHTMEEGSVLLLDPFHGGSHKQLMDLLTDRVKGSVIVSMSAKKWMWRARTGALWLSQNIPYSHQYRILFSSGVLNLAELIALRPDLSKLKKILYFHENQLVYPVRKQQDRDFQYGYNQILSCLVADVVVFNSEYNKNSFLSSINTFLKLMPDYRPKDLVQQIEPKCRVIYFPINLPEPVPNPMVETNVNTQELKGDNLFMTTNEMDRTHVPIKKLKSSADYFCENLEICDIKNEDTKCINVSADEGRTEHTDNECNESLSSEVMNESGQTSQEVFMEEENDISHSVILVERDPVGSKPITADQRQLCPDQAPLHIVWAHRWEHDKDPETFFNVMFQLQDAGCIFKLSVMGEQFSEQPEIFQEAEGKLHSSIVHWGYLPSKDRYYDVLRSADIAVSTALHEFFGVAMMEATYFGCYPLCPNRLVYPEIFPKCYLYNTSTQLFKKLKTFCMRPWHCRNHKIQVPVEKYLWDNCYKTFQELLKDHTMEVLPQSS